MSIRKRRLDKGWSQEELARHAGLSTRTIQRIEGGQKPGLESLKSLAAVFETSMSTLMQEQTMKTPQNSDRKDADVMLFQIEREAIEFAQSILDGPKRSERDPISPIERSAVDFAQRLLGRFRSGE